MEKKIENEREEILDDFDFSSENDNDCENQLYQSLIKYGNDDDLDIVVDKGNSKSCKKQCHLEYDKYFVPIFIAKDDKDSFNGNGVIVGKYLITAAHVAICNKCKRNIPKLYYNYNGNIKEINNKMRIHDGRGIKGKVKADKDGIHDDLIIYEIDDLFSPLQLSEDSLGNGNKLEMWTFWKKDESVITREYWNCSMTEESVMIDGAIAENCFKASNDYGFFHPGNSGSVLYKDNVIYGMLIKANQKGKGSLGTFLRSSYIKKIIEEYETKQNIMR